MNGKNPGDQEGAPLSEGRAFTRRRALSGGLLGALAVLAGGKARARELADTPDTRGPQLAGHIEAEHAHGPAKNLAKRNKGNRFKGAQVLAPGQTDDALRIEVAKDYTGRQIVTTKLVGDRNPTLKEVSWVDGHGIWRFNPQQFGVPDGPGGDKGKSDLPAAADHSHTYYPALFAASGERSWECYKLDGGVYEDMGPTPGVDGRMIHGAFLPPIGEAITSATLFSGDTAMEGCRHIWAALYNYGDHPPYLWLMGQTSDEPGSSWPANTARSFTFPTPLRTTWSEMAWFLGLMIDADVHPSLMGYVQHPSLLSNPVVAPWGTTTGLNATAPDVDEEDFAESPIKRFYFTVASER